MIEPVIPPAGKTFRKAIRQKLYVTKEAIASARHNPSEMIPLNGMKHVDEGYARTIALQAQQEDSNLFLYFSSQERKERVSRTSGKKTFSTLGPVFLTHGLPKDCPNGVKRVAPAVPSAKTDQSTADAGNLEAARAAEERAAKIAAAEAALAEAKAY